ncbi:hypothetical protein Gbro_1082 [Gordonia bronchialis DSM 43247]|jgi:hypothetical protein|uniref:N-acetyltransferase domain-containing protein n=1 Tax=Gordonia bronchialis (strain ATCC 25592 / DSM 43247 / BCRC 13721 / JCM 3198 / KCTC 3076 / NBRC 16047 / NCTC 10667) TaxID=526226 RepID=D0L4T9_GORB4|nr:hypothetical protein [Gordonia bronchialis]ACY20391.1 hypothetical protein Gbro_1082 [Gordonia bronchialis DSM 43247]MCC3323168.1 hypothetical protein [Gordonia bronchialis]QGS25807.1 hypothetical protein FOB84_18440 [Gordonia bronchialis]UAK37794.1 hypothetical protein K8O93_22440 [Gordonia bronchialis]STQ63196.1 Uncharacterised protein [Gordonia bronchialis]
MTIAFASDIRNHVETLDAALTFRDTVSNTTLLVATPSSTPTVWADYIDGAYRSYSEHGVVDALEYETVRDGGNTRLFCAVLDDDRVIGGLRIQGPYNLPTESHALTEWAGQPGQRQLIRAIATRIPGGLVEAKSAYVDTSSPAAAHVAGLMARTPLIVMTLTGCRYVMATSADHVLKRWQSGGGRIDGAIEPTPYPDSRYRTRAMFWDRTLLAQHADPTVWRQMQREFCQVEADLELAAQRQSHDVVA